MTRKAICAENVGTLVYHSHIFLVCSIPVIKQNNWLCCLISPRFMYDLSLGEFQGFL